jgi:hypothetical protein
VEGRTVGGYFLLEFGDFEDVIHEGDVGDWKFMGRMECLDRNGVVGVQGSGNILLL